MSVINTVIGRQNFEIIRDRIGEILASELNNQFLISYDADVDADVFIERFIPFHPPELPAVNIALDRGDYDGQTVKQNDGTYRYLIMCYSLSKSTDAERGDKLAMIKLQKLIGVCRAIIMNPKYKSLGYTTPLVMNRHIENLVIADPGKMEATNMVKGILSLSVKLPETTELIVPTLAAGFDTSWTIAESDSGYQVISNNP